MFEIRRWFGSKPLALLVGFSLWLALLVDGFDFDRYLLLHASDHDLETVEVMRSDRSVWMGEPLLGGGVYFPKWPRALVHDSMLTRDDLESSLGRTARFPIIYGMPVFEFMLEQPSQRK